MWGLSYTCFRAFDALEQFGEIEFECSSHGHGCTEINSKLTTLHFLSNEALGHCKGNLRVELYLILVIWGIMAIIGNWVQIPKNMSMDALKLMQSLQLYILHLMGFYTSERGFIVSSSPSVFS